MCLAKAFLNNWDGQPVFQDIAHLQINGHSVEMRTLFGEQRVIPGHIVKIDFMTSRVLLQAPVERAQAVASGEDAD